MSILFVLLTFLLILTVMYFRNSQPAETVVRAADTHSMHLPVMMRYDGFEVPRGYAFHAGHTWLSDEGHQTARIGVDAFAANLFGEIDAIDFPELNRWVRQGQTLCSVRRGNQKVDLLSPVEGVFTSVNERLSKTPTLATTDPYKDGWFCTIKAPDLAINTKNLLQGAIVPAWMQNSVLRLSQMLGEISTPGLAQDGGVPAKGLLFRISSEVQHELTKEFFLT